MHGERPFRADDTRADVQCPALVQAKAQVSVEPVEVKALQDWTLAREFKKVPGVADIVPFGGYGHSGLGREGGLEGIREYLNTKYTLTPDPATA